MAKKGENIYKRFDGRYEARYVKERDENNKIMKYGYVYGKTYKEAKIKKDLALENIKDIRKKDVLFKQKTFSEEIEKWFDNKLDIKSSTRYNYHTIIYSKLIPYFSNKKLRNINEDSIKKFTLFLLEEGVGNKRIKDILLVLKQFLIYMNISVKVDYPKINKNCVTSMTEDEIILIENKTINSNDIKKFAICLVLYTGLRIGELCALQWKDIDLDNQIINVSKTVSRIKDKNTLKSKTKVIIDYPKTENSIRIIPIHNELVFYLKNFKQNIKDDEVYFLTSTREFFPTNIYYYYYKTFIKNLNFDNKYNFHVLRHTFATRALLNGIDIKTLSEILGHSSVKITLDRYVHINTNEKLNQINRLPFLGIKQSN